jgi:hypothetical protein
MGGTTDILTESLLDSFPPGMFGGEEASGSRNAARMLGIIERLIQESSVQNALLAQYALLQTFPRVESLPPEEGKEGTYTPEPQADILRQYCTALFPESLAGLLPLLNDAEVEILFKNMLLAHETWGHAHGVATLVRTLLEGCLHDAIPVKVLGLVSDDVPIPEVLISHLGRGDQYSALGKNFVLGRRVAIRPKEYAIHVGPISQTQLGRLQEEGWADDTVPSHKLHQIVAVAEPFYLRSRIHYLFEKAGFTLSSALLGKSRLGVVSGEGLA